MNCEENVCYYLESINGKNIFTYLTFNNGLKPCCLERIYHYYDCGQQASGYGSGGVPFEHRYYSMFKYDRFKSIVYNDKIILVSKNSLHQNFINELNKFHLPQNLYQHFYIFKNIDVDENITVFNTEEYNKMAEECNEMLRGEEKVLVSYKMIVNQLKIEIKNYKKEIQYLKSINPKPPKYDYKSIKQKNKALNSEFKRVAKLMNLYNS